MPYAIIDVPALLVHAVPRTYLKMCTTSVLSVPYSHPAAFMTAALMTEQRDTEGLPNRKSTFDQISNFQQFTRHSVARNHTVVRQLLNWWAPGP